MRERERERQKVPKHLSESKIIRKSERENCRGNGFSSKKQKLNANSDQSSHQI